LRASGKENAELSAMRLARNRKVSLRNVRTVSRTPNRTRARVAMLEFKRSFIIRGSDWGCDYEIHYGLAEEVEDKKAA
jgi:hypothetical protein